MTLAMDNSILALALHRDRKASKFYFKWKTMPDADGKLDTEPYVKMPSVVHSKSGHKKNVI